MRDALINAAIDRFGARGFEAVGTREIAAAVGTPMSSITYHFGGKEGLYIAAAEHIFDTMQGLIAPQMAEMPDEQAPRSAHVDAICAALGVVARFMLDERSAAFVLFIIREQQLPTPHVRELMDRKVMPLLHRLAGQIGMIRPDLDEQQAKALAIFLFGMTTSLRHGRGSISLLFGCDPIDRPTQDLLLRELEQAQRAMLMQGLMQGPMQGEPK